MLLLETISSNTSTASTSSLLFPEVRSSYTRLVELKCPVVSGRALGEISMIPKHMYSQVLSNIKLLMSLVGEWQQNNQDEETNKHVMNSIQPWLNANASDLLNKLENVLYETVHEEGKDRKLRSMYVNQKKQKKKKKNKKARLK